MAEKPAGTVIDGKPVEKADDAVEFDQNDLMPKEKPPVVPEWAKAVPEKFRGKTQEETIANLSKGYTEIEKLATAKKSVEPPKVEAPVIPPVNPLVALFGNTDLLIGVGQQFAKEGKLTDEQYTQFETAGIPKHLADQHMLGQQARLKAAALEADIKYGKDTHKALKEWGAANMDPEVFKGMLDKAISSPENAYAGFIGKIAAERNIANGSAGSKALISGADPIATALSTAEIRALVKAAGKGDTAAQNKIKSIPFDQFEAAMDLTKS